MTAQEMNIAIAKWMGWKFDHLRKIAMPPESDQIQLRLYPGFSFSNYDNVPNYAGDLNAIHEAERELTEDLHDRWVVDLAEVTGAIIFEGYSDMFVGFHATAAQRCEALLKTIGRWKETEAAR